MLSAHMFIRMSFRNTYMLAMVFFLSPSSPRTPTVEKFDPDLNSFQPLQKLPECPSYGVAFSLFGKIVFLSVTVGTDPKSDRRVDHMQVELLIFPSLFVSSINMPVLILLICFSFLVIYFPFHTIMSSFRS